MALRQILLSISMLATAFAGCAALGEGSISLYVKDAPTDEFDEVHVVFSEAFVHQGGEGEQADGNATSDDRRDGERGPPSGDGIVRASAQPRDGAGAQETQFREAAGWIALVDEPDGIDVNLLNATGTRAAFLGEANLSTGTYTQIAVVVDDAYGIDENGTRVDITVPSGIGRIVRSFDVDSGVETRITIDLELDRAMTRSEDGWKLTPVFGKTVVEMVDDGGNGSDAHEPGEIAETS